MFEITGELNGELVDNKRISPKQLIEKFNLPIPYEGENASVRFELIGKAVKEKNGQKRHAVSRQMNPLIQATYNGETYFIRYYKSKVQNPGKDGGFRYFPNRVKMNGRVETYNIPDNLEEAVLICLNPSCEDSPFHNHRKPADYKVVNLQERAQAQFEKARANEEARQFLLKTNDEEKIMYIAKGLVFPGGRVISDTLLGSPIEARMALLEETKSHPTLVMKAITDPVVLVRGMMRRAVEQGFVMPQKAGAGRTQWRWKDGSPICTTESNIDALTGLIRFCVNPNNLAGVKSRVDDFLGAASLDAAGDSLKASGAASVITHNIDLENKEAVLMRMVEEDLLWLNRDTLKIYLMKDGKPQTKSIGSVVDKEGWVKKFAEKIAGPQWHQCRNLLKDFLNIQ